MKLALKQLLRNIRSSLGQFLSIMLVVAVGAFLFAGMNEASHTLKKDVDDYYEETALADVTGVFGAASHCAVEKAQQVTGAAAEGRYVINTSLTDEDGSRYDAVLMTATDTVNTPYITQGAAAGEGECLVDETFAAANGIEIGDTVEIFNPQVESVTLQGNSLDPEALSISNYTVTYTAYDDENPCNVEAKVSGFFLSGEYLYKINTADISAARDEFAVVIVPYADIRTTTDVVNIYLNEIERPVFVVDMAKGTVTNGFTGEETDLPDDMRIYNQVLVSGTDMTPDEVFADYLTPYIDETTGNFAIYVSNMSYARADGTSESTFRSAYRQISSLVAIVPTLFFIVAAVITFISLSKMVDNERSQIAVMQAIGRKKSSIYFMYTAYALIAALLGTALGGVAGMFFMPRLYYYVFTLQFVMPPYALALSGGYIVISAVIACAVAAAAAGVSIHKTLRLTPAAAMRPKKEKVARAVFVEKWHWFWNKLGFGGKMIFRNIFRNKLRILLSSIGVVGSVMLLIMGIGMYDRINCAVDAYDDSLNYAYLVVTDDALSLDEYEIAGIEAELTPVPKYSVTVSHEGRTDELVQLAMLPAGSTAIKLVDSRGHALTLADDSLILPHYMADNLGVEAGDTVTLSGVYGQYDCTVTGVAVQYLMPTVYVGRAVYEGLKAPMTADNFYITDADGLTQADLEAVPGVKYARTRAEMADRALETAVVLNIFMTIIVIGAAVLALTVIYNITAINVHEREREIATLMVLGYKRGETSRLILIENVVTTVVGCLLGLPLGYGLFRWVGTVASSMNVSLPLNLTAPVVFLSFGLAFVFSMAATALLLKKLFKIDMVGALKSPE